MFLCFVPGCEAVRHHVEDETANGAMFALCRSPNEFGFFFGAAYQQRGSLLNLGSLQNGRPQPKRPALLPIIIAPKPVMLITGWGDYLCPPDQERKHWSRVQ